MPADAPNSPNPDGGALEFSWSKSKSVETIKIWSFAKAAKKFRALCPPGMEPDWIAHVPAGESRAEFEAFLEISERAQIVKRPLPDGSMLYFGLKARALPPGEDLSARSQTTEERD